MFYPLHLRVVFCKKSLKTKGRLDASDPPAI
nr:MAG TPA: hypothetical protein [Caudoviricetes sp.]